MAGSGGSHYQIEFDSKSPRKEGAITDLKHCLLGAARLLAASHVALAPSPIQSSNRGSMRPQIYGYPRFMGTPDLFKIQWNGSSVWKVLTRNSRCRDRRSTTGPRRRNNPRIQWSPILNRQETEGSMRPQIGEWD